jgi:hypothetical protein
MPRPTSWVFTAPLMLALLSCGESTVFAWGNEGHQLICEIALERLTPAGRTFLDAVRALEADIQDPFEDCQSCSPGHPSDGRTMSFLEGCIWPDESRRDTFKDTYEYHFINTPQAAPGFDLLRDCGMLDCALVGIQRFAQYVAKEPGDSSRERERRALALRFLSHFVGDLHQPLHVGHIEDLGGNLITVKFIENGQTRTDKLHAVWDSAVLRRAGLTIADAHALNAEITATEATQWATFTIADWATESEALARQRAYTKPDGTQVQDGDSLDDAYFTPAIDTVKVQIKKAGVRLAMLIDAAAAGTLPANLLKLTP